LIRTVNKNVLMHVRLHNEGLKLELRMILCDFKIINVLHFFIRTKELK